MKRMEVPDKKIWFEGIIIGFLFSVLALFIYKIGKSTDFFFYNSEDGITIDRTIQLFCQYKKSSFFVGLTGFWILSTTLYVFLVKTDNEWRRTLYKYRYAIACLIMLIGVVLEISGSSISSLCSALGVDPSQGGVLFRTANPYRSDEFGLNTIFAIAQGKDPDNLYPYISNIVRGTNTDMYIVYGQPVKDIGILFRPFQWGYLLLGSAKGLAFFWCGRLIFLFMTSFEFGRLLLKNKKVIAVTYGVFVAFSPVIQWWFAINGFVEMLIFGQLCAIAIYLFMNAESTARKIVCSVIFFWSGCVFILLFYPAWQVVFGYIYLGIFIWIIIENRKKLHWEWKKDGFIVFVPALILGSILIFLLIRSADTISTVMGTVYPGHRLVTSKLQLSDLFGSMYNVYLALTDSHMLTVWGFIDLFPMGIILACYVLFKLKVKDVFLQIMLGIDIVFILIFTLPVPEILLKVSLLSLTTCDRALIAIQFINLLLLFRSISFLKGKLRPINVVLGALIYAAFVTVIFVRDMKEDIPLSNIMVAGMFLLLLLAFVLAWTQKNVCNGKWFLIFSIMLFSIAGGLVNPVQAGLPMLEKSNLLREIEAVVKIEGSDAKWISVDCSYPNTNIPLLVGASTINSTNVYPALERWEALDPTGKYEKIYNRYAHILVTLQKSGKTDFELLAPDYFQLNLAVDDLETMEVKYILSSSELEDYSNRHVSIEKYKEIGSNYIYKVIY